MLGVRVGGDQRERGEVVAGDPGGGVGVEHVGPVAQPQHAPAVRAARRPTQQHGVLGEVAAVAGRVEHGLERAAGQAQLAAERRRPGSPGAPAAPSSTAGASLHAAPATTPARWSAGRAAAGRPAGDVAGHRPRARRTARRAPWRARPAAPSSSGTASSSASRARGRQVVLGDRRLVLGDARRRARGSTAGSR